MKTKPILRSVFVVLAFALVTAGCAHVQKTTFTTPPLDGQPRIPAHVALVVVPEAVDYHYRYSAMGENWDYHFGPAIEKYAKAVVGATFVQVTQYPSESAAAGKADAVIVVSGPKAQHTLPMSAWGTREFVLRLDWAANDGTGQVPIWRKTMEGKAGRPWGSRYTWDKTERDIMQDLFAGLSTSTYKAISDSPEVRKISSNPK